MALTGVNVPTHLHFLTPRLLHLPPQAVGGVMTAYASFAENVMLSQAWKGHYPTLQLKPGKLVKRVGQFWAVAFEGQPSPLLMNTNVGMQQLAYATPAAEPGPDAASEAPQ